MNPVEHILMDYRNAGEDHRLDLFLAYRDLRDRFREIERVEPPSGSLGESPALDGLLIPCTARSACRADA
jgi:hypothetical protein